ncbi:hypothetical protein G3I59_14920 [Amycolatopsis rubida]|uniref:Uncharacterized protein n=1 Tax=Amycolatopsis rubida TaxID=112413 RepID=A0ABX0BQZ5_9PSEU|nr:MULTISPECIES: hypothetical protein [Amycolatopsis]MYW91855.1 hypothetical protein [Amycolatopsis rubida]NEC56840.1 hypothetical protein [Amycolatopsis rubida]
MLKKLYCLLPKQSMMCNAARLHVSQPALSQYLSLTRIPPATFLKAIHLEAAARTAEDELPGRLDELIELRHAAKESILRARRHDLTAEKVVVHTPSDHKTAGKKDRRNGKSHWFDRRNGKRVAPPELDGDAQEYADPATSGAHLKADGEEPPSAVAAPASAVAEMVSAAIASLPGKDCADARALLEQAELLLRRVVEVELQLLAY